MGLHFSWFPFAFMFSALFCHPALGQYQWQNPLPQGNHIRAIESISAQLGFAGGDAGTLLKTTSGGQIWTIARFPERAEISRIQFVDGMRGWACGVASGKAVLYGTTDGGETWVDRTPTAGSEVAFTFLNGSLGWASVDSAVYVTNDAGVVWKKRGSGGSISCLSFTDSLNGWGVAGSIVVHTIDGGKSWMTVVPDTATSGSPNGYTQVDFIDSSVGWVVGRLWGPQLADGFIYATTDGGAQWTRQLHVGSPQGQYRSFSDLVVRNRNILWAVSDWYLYRSTNGGGEWQNLGRTKYLRTIASIDDSTLWGAGDLGTLYCSHDGGGTWQQTSRGFDTRLLDLQLTAGSRLYAAGGAAVLSSDDKGGEWGIHPVVVPGSPIVDIHAVWFSDSLHGWCGTEHIGGWGRVLRTTDGGYTWEVQVDSIHRVFTMLFTSDGTGWFGSGSLIYRSTDNGKNWVFHGDLSPSSGMEVKTLSFPSPDSGWAGGFVGLFRTADAGYSWDRVDLPGEDIVVEDLFFLNPKTGWVVGEHGRESYIFKTTDGGSTWSSQDHPVTADYSRIVCVCFRDQNRGWVAGTSLPSPVLQTTDGGETWVPTDIPTSLTPSCVRFLPGVGGWITFELGGILHFPDLAVSVAEILWNPVADDISLSQNFPNPFNPSTTIRYSLPTRSQVTLSVFNTLGQKVAILDEGEREVGFHEVVFDGNGLASGVYLYRIVAGAYAATKRLLLLR